MTLRDQSLIWLLTRYISSSHGSCSSVHTPPEYQLQVRIWFEKQEGKKWTAWNKVKGTPRKEAQEQYIAKVKELQGIKPKEEGDKTVKEAEEEIDEDGWEDIWNVYSPWATIALCMQLKLGKAFQYFTRLSYVHSLAQLKHISCSQMRAQVDAKTGPWSNPTAKRY